MGLTAKGGVLTAKGGKLGNPIPNFTVWRGINLSGAEFGHEPATLPGTVNVDFMYHTQQDMNYLVGRGVRTIRFPFRWERLQPVLNGPLDAAELGRIKATLSQAYQAGAKVILDVHNYAEFIGADDVLRRIGDGVLTKAHLADLWTRLTNEVKGNKGLLGYGIMNEPRDLSPSTGSATGTTVYDFETTAQGWAGDGNAGARSTAQAQSGVGSFAATKTLTAGYNQIRANDMGANTLVGTNGKTIRAWVLVPTGVAGAWRARLEVQNNAFQWQFGPETVLTAGTWTEISYTPSDALWLEAPGPIGVQFMTDNGTAGSVTVHIDTVRQVTVTGAQTSAQVWEDACLTAGRAIRTAGGTETIYAPGYQYSGAQQWTTQHAAPWMAELVGVVYEAHYYFDRNNSGTYVNTYAAETTDATGRGYASLAARATAEVNVFLDWLAAHNVKGHIGEIGWSNVGDTVGWNSVGEVLYDLFDAAGVGVTAWAAGSWYSTTYNLSVYTGTPLSTAKSVATIIEAHPSVL